MSDEHADQADDPTAGGPPNPLERALDLLLYGPVGVAVTVAEDLPGLVDKGRQRVEQEVSNARVVGKFFVGQLPNQIEQLVQQRLGGLLNLFGSDSEAAGEPDAAPTFTNSSSDHAGDPHSPVPTTTLPQAPPKPAADPADTAVVEQALAGYDTLSASQVVRRLESLGADQLRAVHRHEASHRNRRTILNRTSQLLDEAGPTASLAE